MSVVAARCRRMLPVALGLFWCAGVQAADPVCTGTDMAHKQLYWGDLHVHSGYSLDAWGFGTAASPTQAYEFARGEPLRLASGQHVQLDRPLDFMAVTDHAEWFDLMYLCTDPQRSDDPYCDVLTEKNTPAAGGAVFQEYVLPTITKAQPQPTPLCQDDPRRCARARAAQWQRVQDQANAANDPCAFTSFVGFEWSATPDFSHNHRNVIFASEAASAEAIDYLRHPSPEQLWQALDRQCQRADGCEAIAIPHNTNMGDGRSFDVETEAPATLELRARYERLVEIHQEKGSSECLPAFGSTDEDCSFEQSLTRQSRPTPAADYTAQQWRRMRGGYVRQLLLRGLRSYAASGERAVNPLQLGIIGSTDNHTATGGFVDEATWPGTAFGLGSLDRLLARGSWNPGGLVAVWAEENTRASLFAALKRREVYATSGPRLRVRLAAAGQRLGCEAATPVDAQPMGSTLGAVQAVHFKIEAQADRHPLAEVQIIKGELHGGELREQVMTVWQQSEGRMSVCARWQDDDFDAAAPAFWYARVLQAPTPRWSAYQCQRAGRCDEFPGADRWIRERAWTSPVWHLPGPGNEPAPRAVSSRGTTEQE
jgi:hypothetical protein